MSKRYIIKTFSEVTNSEINYSRAHNAGSMRKSLDCTLCIVTIDINIETDILAHADSVWYSKAEITEIINQGGW